MPTIAVELVKLAIPIVMDIVKHHREKNNGQIPTEEQILATFNQNIDKYLAEGEAWRAAHPDA
jgi:hypothetical protein